MCLSPSAWKLIHSTDAIERIVKLLKETENADCQQTYIRAVRYQTLQICTHLLTLCLLVLSAENFCNHFGPRLGLAKCQARS